MRRFQGWCNVVAFALFVLLGSVLTAQAGQQVGEASSYAREMGKDQLFFYDSSNRVQYICEADPGTASSAAKWRIKQFVYVASGNGAGQTQSILWANGSDEMNAICDNRASLSYS